MSSKPSAAARFVTFIVGVPGYLLTLIPWMFVITLVLLVVAKYSDDGDISFDYLKIQYESLLITPTQVVAIGLMSLGLWIFMAWFTKRVLLWISSKFGESEKTWQVTKITALISGWFAVALVAIFAFENLNPGFVLSELLVTGIGLISIVLEYGLTRLWLTKH